MNSLQSAIASRFDYVNFNNKKYVNVLLCSSKVILPNTVMKMMYTYDALVRRPSHQAEIRIIEVLSVFYQNGKCFAFCTIVLDDIQAL